MDNSDILSCSRKKLVIVESRRPLCWSCGAAGHLSTNSTKRRSEGEKVRPNPSDSSEWTEVVGRRGWLHLLPSKMPHQKWLFLQTAEAVEGAAAAAVEGAKANVASKSGCKAATTAGFAAATGGGAAGVFNGCRMCNNRSSLSSRSYWRLIAEKGEGRRQKKTTKAKKLIVLGQRRPW